MCAIKIAIKDDFMENLSYEDEIKSIGYSKIKRTFLTMRKNKKTLSFEEMIKKIDICKKYKVEIEFIHLQIEKELNSIWRESSDGDIYIKNMYEIIKKLCEYTKLFVMHVYYKDEIKQPNETGMKRLKWLNDKCGEIGVKIAIENVDNPILDYYVLKNLDKFDNFGYCFDVGHSKFFGTYQNRDLLEEFKDKLLAVHIHDNDGMGDNHELPYKENFSYFNKIFKVFEKYLPTKCYTFEVNAKNGEKPIKYLNNLYEILEEIQKVQYDKKQG